MEAGRTDYFLSADRRILTARFTGVFDAEVAWPALDLILGLGTWKPEYDLILDFSDVSDLDVSLELIREVGERIHGEDKHTGKTAIVIGGHAVRRTLAEYFVAVLDLVSTTPSKVFGDLEEAEGWIRG